MQKLTAPVRSPVLDVIPPIDPSLENLSANSLVIEFDRVGLLSSTVLRVPYPTLRARRRMRRSPFRHQLKSQLVAFSASFSRLQFQRFLAYHTNWKPQRFQRA